MKNNRYLIVLWACCLQCLSLRAQQNHAVILPADSPEMIVQKAANVVPSPRQLRWQQLELTAFFHFGVNTFANQEWGHGTESPAIFNPTDLDANQWVSTCQKAGIKQVILTAKHHDGFCLWPSRYTEHSVKNSPWQNGKGDVVREVADACKRYKLGFGIYLSPWDRNSPIYGTEAYNDYFVQQLTELLTQYGRIDEVWFDGACGEGPNGKKQVYDFERWYAVIRRLQPAATIAIMGPDVRWVGTESGYGRETEWSVVPAEPQWLAQMAADSQQDISFPPLGDLTGNDLGSRSKLANAKGLIWYPAETDVSIRPGWFYHPEEDNKVKTPAKLLDIYFSSVGCNSVLLLNLPPDTKGQLHPNDVANLIGWKKLMEDIFDKNLAKGAKITVPNGRSTKNMLDKKTHTHFTTVGNDTTTTLEFDLKSSQTFDVLLLQENIRIGQRIEQFVLEYWADDRWQMAVSGTTVGYKRLLRFAPVHAKRVRLRILASRLNPTIAEFGLYKLPEEVKFTVNNLHSLRQSPTQNKATQRPTQLTYAPSEQYNRGGRGAWNNGVFGSNVSFNDAEWLGWSGQDFEGIIDFGQTEPLQKVSIDFFNQPQSWIYMPAQVSLYGSDNGIDFWKIDSQQNFNIADDGVQRVAFQLSKTETKYLKIVAKHYGSIPKGSPGAGSPAWLFVDEVVVE